MSLEKGLEEKNESSYSICDPAASEGISVPGSAVRSTMYSLKFATSIALINTF
jgi:hypothetical protein